MAESKSNWRMETLQSGMKEANDTSSDGHCIFIIVDDSLAIVRLNERKLKLAFGNNIIVQSAGDGTEAVALVKVLMKEEKQYNRIVAILMDYHMPKCFGSDAIVSIRELEKQNRFDPPVPIIGFTADASSEVANAMLSAGANFILSKPPEAGELEAVCAELYENKKKELQAQSTNVWY